MEQRITVKQILKSVFVSIIVIASLVAIFGSFYTVDQGEKGLIRRFGETVKVVDAGLGFKTPLIEEIILISTREKTKTYGQFVNKDDLIEAPSAYTRDQQTVFAMISLTYKVSDPLKLYERYRGIENFENQILDKTIREQLEATFSKFSAKESVEKRQELSESLAKNVQSALENQPISVSAVRLSAIKYNDEYERQIEESVKKNVELETAHRKLLIEQKEAEILQTKAEAQAKVEVIGAKAKSDTLRLQAEAEAYSIKERGLAEANAIKAKSEALSQNPNVVALQMAEKWDGKLPQYQLGGTNNSPIQLLNVNELLKNK